MREVQASEAKARLPSLLDEVERGETLIITRNGKAIARIVRLLKSLPLSVATDTGEDEVMRLARTHRLTVYDAAYLELALRRRLFLGRFASTGLVAAISRSRAPVRLDLGG